MSFEARAIRSPLTSITVPAPLQMDAPEDDGEHWHADERGDDADGYLGYGHGTGQIVDRQNIDGADEGRRRQKPPVIRADERPGAVRDDQANPADDPRGGHHAGREHSRGAQDGPLEEVESPAEGAGLFLPQ